MSLNYFNFILSVESIDLFTRITFIAAGHKIVSEAIPLPAVPRAQQFVQLTYYLKLMRHFTLLYRIIVSSLLEGVNLLVSSGTASAIAGDRLLVVKRKTARQSDPNVSLLYKKVY